MIAILKRIFIFVVIGILMNENSRSEIYCSKLCQYIKSLDEAYVPIVKTLLVRSERLKGSRYKKKYGKI